jgi:hypothetical protein
MIAANDNSIFIDTDQRIHILIWEVTRNSTSNRHHFHAGKVGNWTRRKTGNLLPLQLPKKMLQEEDLDSMDLRSQGPMTRSGERNDEKTKSTAIDAFVSKLSATKLGYYNDRYLPIILQSLHREMRKQPIINRGIAENTHMSTLPASSVLIPLQVITPEFNV